MMEAASVTGEPSRLMGPDPRPTNAEMAQLVAMLEDAGLVEVYTEDEGREAYRLTEEESESGTCSLWSSERTRIR